ncbi:HAMP domain-containing histidine kinase [Fusobacterium nucleatum]|uniref:coaggregation-regulating histidine kinase CarS n=1 Tax=Fusobacterium nucleatum TaxID=851 RepID=UPI003D087A33
MFLKKKSRPFSKIPVSIRVTVWFTTVIIFLFSIVLSSAILLEDRYINNTSTEELVNAVEKIYEDPDEFENFDDGIYYIKYNENNDIIAGKIPKDFDTTLAFSIEDINTYQIENRKFLYYDTRLKNTGDWIRGIYPLSRFQNDISRMWNIVFYYLAPLFIAFVSFVGYKIVKNAFQPVKKISETALAIKKSKNFSRRIELDYGEDEIHKMASTFNEMLDTLEEVFIHEKQFSSDVSHELRTPISVILAQSDYAINYTETLNEAIESFEVINRQAEKMKNLVNQIMELSKLERQNEIEKERVNFSNIILESLRDYKTLLEINEEKKIELIIDVEKDLRIYGNRLMLERLFVNLFVNAMKFTQSVIVVSLNRENRETILQIKDDGIGISTENQKYIWDRFFQIDDSRNKDENIGSGLGLSMVNRIVQLHSATIELESEMGKGSCFIVKFPI